MRLRFAFISIVIGCLALTGCSNQRIMQELNIVSEEIMVNDKLYKVIRAEDTVTMLYKVDTSFYIRIELFGAVQFDSSGNDTEVTCSPSDYLDNGWLDKEIVINITPAE